MRDFVLRRLLLIIPIMLGVSFLTFLMFRIIPGDAAIFKCGLTGTPECIEEVRRGLGLDRPWYVQYGDWLWGVVRGDLGRLTEVLEVVRAQQVDCIYHLGAMISMPAEANPWAAYDANANGTYHVLEAARIFGIGPVLFLTGIATYGPGAPETVNEDVFQSNPSQIYAATKIFGERLGEYYHHRFGIEFRCIR